MTRSSNEKLAEARDTLSTIIHFVDSRGTETNPEVVLDMIRSAAVNCLDTIREED